MQQEAVPLAGTPVEVQICTEGLSVACGQVKVRLDTAVLAARCVAAEEGAQDLTDTADAVRCWGVVQVQPGQLHNLGDERTETEVPQMHRRTGLSNDRSSFEVLGITLTRQAWKTTYLEEAGDTSDLVKEEAVGAS